MVIQPWNICGDRGKHKRLILGRDLCWDRRVSRRPGSQETQHGGPSSAAVTAVSANKENHAGGDGDETESDNDMVDVDQRVVPMKTPVMRKRVGGMKHYHH